MKSLRAAIYNLTLSAMLIGFTTGPVRAVEVGQEAPDFELESTQGGKLKLSSLRGKNVLIQFYVLDYTPT